MNYNFIMENITFKLAWSFLYKNFVLKFDLYLLYAIEFITLEYLQSYHIDQMTSNFI
jgi:hypothetical protein